MGADVTYSLVLLLVLLTSTILASFDVVLLLSLRARLLLLGDIGSSIHVEVENHFHARVPRRRSWRRLFCAAWRRLRRNALAHILRP